MKYEKIYLILLLLIALGILFYFSLRAVSPTKVEREKVEEKVKEISIDENIFQNPVVSQMKQYKEFGQLPAVLDKGQQGKDNPFGM